MTKPALGCPFRLPAKFVQDRLGRDLDCGAVEFKGRQAIIECSVEVFDDLKSDAEYQGWHTDYEDRSLIQSARRAYQVLTELAA